MRKAARRLSPKEVVQANELLAANLVKQENGLYAYSAGWSDMRIAREIGEDVASHTIARLRRELFGDIRTRGPNRANTALEELQSLKDMVTALQNQLQREVAARQEMSAKLEALSRELETLRNAHNNVTRQLFRDRKPSANPQERIVCR